uniref:Uncharacterized protein n=1 Tax=Panagrellus redivivus TaxID=6233 RepID=A0A7E4VJ24_PANRE
MAVSLRTRLFFLAVLSAVLVQTFAVPVYFYQPEALGYRVKRQWGWGGFGGGGSQSQVSDQSGSRTTFEDIKTPFGEIDIGQTQTFNNFNGAQSNFWG